VRGDGRCTEGQTQQTCASPGLVSFTAEEVENQWELIVDRAALLLIDIVQAEFLLPQPRAYR
jgi:hypothetical protein